MNQEEINKKNSSTPLPPNHVAVIMDGNGRWANARKLPRKAGHKKGAEALKKVVEAAHEQGVKYITFYSFSSENWNRPQDEIKSLMNLLRYYLKTEVSKLVEENIRLRVIGRLNKLDEDIVEMIEKAQEKTKYNDGLNVTLALSYGGREEIIDACKKISKKVLDKKIDICEIDEKTFKNNLYTQDIPNPDLLIRTSGEIRISNFLLWQLAYAEFVFLDVLWPDFSKNDFEFAIEEYKNRCRRFGKVL